MFTVLLYVVVMVLVGGLVFFVGSFVFGRSEELGPLPPGTTATKLPRVDVTGGDVRDLRFQQVFRGYKAGEVDWALDRLADEIDRLRSELASQAREHGHESSATGEPSTATPHAEGRVHASKDNGEDES